MAAGPSAAPDAEVRAIAKRQQFNAAHKLSLLDETDRCTNPGAIGAPLRRWAATAVVCYVLIRNSVVTSDVLTVFLRRRRRRRPD